MNLMRFLRNIKTFEVGVKKEGKGMAKIDCPGCDCCVRMICETTVISDFLNEGIALDIGQEGYEQLRRSWENERKRLINEDRMELKNIDIEEIIAFLGENRISLTNFMGQYE